MSSVDCQASSLVFINNSQNEYRLKSQNCDIKCKNQEIKLSNYDKIQDFEYNNLNFVNFDLHFIILMS